MAVSYTHLDVYKRQGYLLDIHLSFIQQCFNCVMLSRLADHQAQVLSPHPRMTCRRIIAGRPNPAAIDPAAVQSPCIFEQIANPLQLIVMIRITKQLQAALRQIRAIQGEYFTIRAPVHFQGHSHIAAFRQDRRRPRRRYKVCLLYTSRQLKHNRIYALGAGSCDDKRFI